MDIIESEDNQEINLISNEDLENLFLDEEVSISLTSIDVD